jgi:Family of unknown function (DUF6519)
MKGDFTRDTFDPLKNFSRVLMQQGRVQVDADWNEQNSILLHYIRTLAMDLMGHHAGPSGDCGFAISIEDKGEVWIGAGRYYVEGILVENEQKVLYTKQLGDADIEIDKLKNELEAVMKEGGLFYLDVWERHITFVQDDRIREVALGGVDTCTRAQVVWEVKVLMGDDIKCTSLDELRRNVDELPKLRARAKRGGPSPELCPVSPESKYRGLENQLYRVEVHEVDASGSTFKWSRDNGSVVFPIVSLSGTTAIVASLGRDQCSQLKPGDWVEVCDDICALRGQSGPLAQVNQVDRDELRITLIWPDGLSEQDKPSYEEEEIPGKHPLLRRWDHDGDLAENDGALAVTESPTTDDGWIALEDGVEIWFAKDGKYRVGDYWLIPARVATGDVEWPVELDEDHERIPSARPLHGPAHYYAPLRYFAKNDVSGTDCRCGFDPPVVCKNQP